MKMISRRVITLVLCTLMLVLLISCGQSGTVNTQTSPAATTTPGNASPDTSKGAGTATPSKAPVGDKSITIKLGQAGNGLGDFTVSGSVSENFAAVSAIYNIIFYPIQKLINGHPIFSRSGNWEDANTFVMTMRDDVVFSNGDKATGEDLLYSFTSFVPQGAPQWLKEMAVLPDQSTVRDKYTVALKVSQKTEQLFSRYAVLYDKKWGEATKYAPEAWYNPVGSGPYYVYKYTPDQSIILKLRDNYWLKPVTDYAVKEYDITYYADQATAYMALQIGDIDMLALSNTSYDDIMKTGKDHGLDVATMKNGVTSNLYFGFKNNPVWGNKDMRMAVALGVNWADLSKLMGGNAAVRATSITPSDGPLYYNAGSYKFDPEQAKQLVAKAGHKPDEVTLVGYMTDDPAYKAFGEGITYYLGKIGIKTNITYGDFPSTLAHWFAAGEVQFNLHNNIRGSATRNPTTSINIANGSGMSWGYVDNDEFQKLYAELSSDFDSPVDVRKPLAEKLQKLIFDEVLIIPISEDQSFIGFNTKALSKEGLLYGCDAATAIHLERLGLGSNWKKMT